MIESVNIYTDQINVKQTQLNCLKPLVSFPKTSAYRTFCGHSSRPETQQLPLWKHTSQLTGQTCSTLKPMSHFDCRHHQALASGYRRNRQVTKNICELLDGDSICRWVACQKAPPQTVVECWQESPCQQPTHCPAIIIAQSLVDDT